MPRSSDEKRVKVKMRAKELAEGDVAYISLVSRPASRAPFKVLKAEDKQDSEEDLMIHLNEVLKRDGEEAVSPTGVELAAVAVRKSELERLTPALEAAGIETHRPTERGEVVLLSQCDCPSVYKSELHGFQISEDLVALVAGDVERTRKGFDPFAELASFDENVKASGFMPGVMVASEALQGTMVGILLGAASPAEARVAIQAAVKEFGAYITNLTADLPEAAFKLETLDMTDQAATAQVEKDMHEGEGKKCPDNMMWDEEMGKCVPKADADKGKDKEKPKTEDAEKAGPETGCPKGQIKVDGKCVPNDEGRVAPGNRADGSSSTNMKPGPAMKEELTEAVKGDIDPEVLESDGVVADDEPAQEEQVVAEKDEHVDDGAPAWFAAFAADVKESISGVREDLESLKKAQAEAQDRLETVEETAQKADEAVRGTVPSGSDVPDDTLSSTQRTSREKAEEELWGGTALDRLGW